MNKDEFTKSVTSKLDQLAKEQHHNKMLVMNHVLDTVQNNAVQDALAAKFAVPVESIDTQIVGPSWGKEITRKAVYGLFGFLIFVMLYLAMAFEPKMAIAAPNSSLTMSHSTRQMN